MEYAVKAEKRERQPYAAVRTTLRMDAIGAAMGPLFGELFGSLGRRGLAPVGAPWTRYLAVGDEECELELGVALAESVAADGRVQSGTFPACEVAVTEHVGPYDEMGAAYTAIGEWMAANDAQPAGAMWEVYLTDPQSEPDPAKYRTVVCMPISRTPVRA